MSKYMSRGLVAYSATGYPGLNMWTRFNYEYFAFTGPAARARRCTY